MVCLGVCIFHFKAAWFGSCLLLSSGMSLMAPVEDSAPWRTMSCHVNTTMLRFYFTALWIVFSFICSLTAASCVSLKTTELKINT